MYHCSRKLARKSKLWLCYEAVSKICESFPKIEWTWKIAQEADVYRRLAIRPVELTVCAVYHGSFFDNHSALFQSTTWQWLKLFRTCQK